MSLPVETTTWPGPYDCDTAGVPPKEPLVPLPLACPYPLTTTRLPLIFVSLEESTLATLWINIYSVPKPVAVTFFAVITSPAAKPLAFATWIVVSLTPTSLEPVIVVEFPTYNWPPTALTVSFSNTAVLSVPRMVTCSNSALPLPIDDILQPFTPLWNVEVSSKPLEFITKLFDDIVSVPIFQPPICCRVLPMYITLE